MMSGRKDGPEHFYPSPEMMENIVLEKRQEEARLLEQQQRDQRNGESKLRRLFLEHCDDLAQYWANQPDLTPYERTNGVVYSVLAAIDGTSPQVPAFDMISATNEEVGNTLIEEGTLITGPRDLRGEYTRVVKNRTEAATKQVNTDE